METESSLKIAMLSLKELSTLAQIFSKQVVLFVRRPMYFSGTEVQCLFPVQKHQATRLPYVNPDCGEPGLDRFHLISLTSFGIISHAQSGDVFSLTQNCVSLLSCDRSISKFVGLEGL